MRFKLKLSIALANLSAHCSEKSSNRRTFGSIGTSIATRKIKFDFSQFGRSEQFRDEFSRYSLVR